MKRQNNQEKYHQAKTSVISQPMHIQERPRPLLCQERWRLCIAVTFSNRGLGEAQKGVSKASLSNVL